MQILKDASSAAIYGSRASTGCIDYYKRQAQEAMPRLPLLHMLVSPMWPKELNL